MTYAIQGPMDHPQVIVNPLSMLAPGIFREIFQMTNPNPKVQRRDDTPNPTSRRERAGLEHDHGGAQGRAARVGGRGELAGELRHRRRLVVADDADAPTKKKQ